MINCVEKDFWAYSKMIYSVDKIRTNVIRPSTFFSLEGVDGAQRVGGLHPKLFERTLRVLLNHKLGATKNHLGVLHSTMWYP